MAPRRDIFGATQPNNSHHPNHTTKTHQTKATKIPTKARTDKPNNPHHPKSQKNLTKPNQQKNQPKPQPIKQITHTNQNHTTKTLPNQTIQNTKQTQSPQTKQHTPPKTAQQKPHQTTPIDGFSPGAEGLPPPRPPTFFCFPLTTRAPPRTSDHHPQAVQQWSTVPFE